jgi:hypothetical protein
MSDENIAMKNIKRNVDFLPLPETINNGGRGLRLSFRLPYVL